MPIRHTLAVTALLSAPVALAQQQAAALNDVTVTGASDLLGNFIKASINVQPGAALSTVNLRQVEQDALATGYLKSVSASLQVVGGQNVLQLAVVPNPVINTVNVSGLTFLPADGFKTSLANVLNIAPGATLNTARVDQAKEALAQNFRSEGYPFSPSISTTTKAATNGTVDLTFVVDETAPVKRIEVSGNTLLPRTTVVNAFQPLYDAKKFTPDGYFAAVQQIQQAYQAAGYLASGVNTSTSTLDGGVLKVNVVEGKVGAVDTSELTLPAGAAPVLQTKAGGVPSLSVLEQDVRTLSNVTGQSVGFALAPTDASAPNVVAVRFGVAEAVTGPIKSISIVGNTALKTAELQAVLKEKVGDVFSRQLAETDFVRLRDAYRSAGYDVSTRDAVKFENGVLTFTLHEARVAGYQVTWTGPKRTQERVITRQLPAAGTLYNDKSFRRALDAINGLGFVKITGVSTKAADANAPENLTYVIGVSEVSGTRSIPVGLQYDTISGFAGTLDLQNNNVFGLGHVLSANLTAAPNDAGQVFSGSLAYTIPWLDIDFADFRRNPTSVGASIASQATGNNALLDASDADTGRQYTVRATGFGVNIGRQLIPNLSVSANVGTRYSTYTLEPLRGNETSALTDAQATALLPASSLTTTVGASAGYSNVSTPDFPTDGFRVNLSAAYGFGRAGTTPLGWTQIEGGASKYFGFGRTLDKGFGTQQKQQAFAVRVNAGTLLGTPPAGTVFTIGYSNVNPAYELRGYPTGAFRGTNYVTGSAEYRYDLGLGNSIAKAVYLIGFADAGTAYNPGNPANFGYSIGAGVQLNLGLGGATLPSLRFDYGFSPTTGSGQFHFRLGGLW